jgi:hypothetical protein
VVVAETPVPTVGGAVAVLVIVPPAGTVDGLCTVTATDAVPAPPMVPSVHFMSTPL